jgi:hypothetical protein
MDVTGSLTDSDSSGLHTAAGKYAARTDCGNPWAVEQTGSVSGPVGQAPRDSRPRLCFCLRGGTLCKRARRAHARRRRDGECEAPSAEHPRLAVCPKCCAFGSKRANANGACATALYARVLREPARPRRTRECCGSLRDRAVRANAAGACAIEPYTRTRRDLRDRSVRANAS